MTPACRLLLVLSGLALPALAAAQRAEAPEKAAFRRGSELFEKRDYDAAIQSFEEAYRLKPHFLLQCNIARCHELTGDVVKAAEHYKRCLDEGAARTRRAPEVKAALAEVESKVASVEVSTRQAGGTIYLDGTEAGPAPGRVLLNPGAHVIEVRREGATARGNIEARPGDRLSLSLDPVAAPPQSQPTTTRRRLGRLRPHSFWIAAAATVVCAGLAIGFGAATLAARKDYEKDPSDENYDKGLARRTVTNVFWGLSAAALGTTAVLFIFTDFKGERAKTPGPTAFGVGLGGSF